MRPEQMQALPLERQAAFRRRARQSLQRIWPDECEEIGEEGLEERLGKLGGQWKVLR